MKMKLITSLLLLTIYLNTFSQVDNLYSLYQYNTNIINPAYAGSHETLDIGVMRKWDYIHLFDFESIGGAPRVFIANIHSPISKRIGLGFSYENDKIGPLKENDYHLDFSYKYSFKDESSIAAGIKVGRNNLDFPIYYIDLLDQNMSMQLQPLTLSNIGLGVYYKNKKLHAGLAYSYYYGEYLSFQSSSFMVDDNYSGSITNGFVAYLFAISGKIKLKPSLMIMTSSDLDETWFFISGNVYFDKDLEVGIHYNFSKAMAVSINTPLVLDFFKIGLNIDFLEKGTIQNKSYQNISLYTNFYIDAFGKKRENRYF